MMDPISLIIGALVAGVQESASNAVKDAYAGLKTLIQRKFAGKSKAEAALVNHEEDPETYELPLKKALQQEHIDQDEEIIKKAQRLMALIQPQQAAQGKFNVQMTGPVQGSIVGDHAQQKNDFR
jgi:hypothetical protein